MNPLVGMIANQLSGPVLEQIGQQIGADSNSTQSAINTALPMMLSALGSHASNEGGAAELQQEAHNNDSVLDDILGFVGNTQGGGMGGALLNQLMGGNNNAIANVVSQHTGIGTDSVMQLLAILTPIVMGAMSKFSQSEGLDANGLAQMVGDAAGSSGGNDLMGLATKMLDADGDGNVMEEIGGLIGRFF